MILMEGRSVRLETEGGVRTLVLTAAQRRNALDADMLGEIEAAIAMVAADPDARVLMIRAEGKAFCAGADVHSLFGDPTRPPAEIRTDLKGVYARFLGIMDLKIPTIAAVDGAAVGAGVNIALACDVIVAGPHAKFVISFADIGLHPGGGCSWFLTRRLGYPRAMAVILGAETLDGAAAHAAGLISEQCEDPSRRALELARKYAQRSPQLMRDMKRAVQIAAASDLGTTVDFESWAQASSVTEPEFQEYIANFGR